MPFSKNLPAIQTMTQQQSEQRNISLKEWVILVAIFVPLGILLGEFLKGIVVPEVQSLIKNYQLSSLQERNKKLYDLILQYSQDNTMRYSNNCYSSAVNKKPTIYPFIDNNPNKACFPQPGFNSKTFIHIENPTYSLQELCNIVSYRAVSDGLQKGIKGKHTAHLWVGIKKSHTNGWDYHWAGCYGNDCFHKPGNNYPSLTDTTENKIITLQRIINHEVHFEGYQMFCGSFTVPKNFSLKQYTCTSK